MYASAPWQLSRGKFHIVFEFGQHMMDPQVEVNNLDDDTKGKLEDFLEAGPVHSPILGGVVVATVTVINE